MEQRAEESLVIVDHVYKKIGMKMYLVPVYEERIAPDELLEDEEQWPSPVYEEEYEDQNHYGYKIAIGVAVFLMVAAWLYAAPPVFDWTAMKIDSVTASMKTLGHSILDLLGMVLMFVIPVSLVTWMGLAVHKRGRRARPKEVRPVRTNPGPTPGRSVTINHITINRIQNEE